MISESNLLRFPKNMSLSFLLEQPIFLIEKCLSDETDNRNDHFFLF